MPLVVSLGPVTAPTIRLRAPLGLAAAAAALCLLAAAGRDFWAPDEPDFAEHVREMLERRSLLLPYENGKPYSEKPILYYWAVTATARLLGSDVYIAARVRPRWRPRRSLRRGGLAGMRGGENEALLAGAATAVAPIVFWQGEYVQVDAVFSGLLMLSLLCFFLESEEGPRTRLWLWVLRVSLAPSSRRVPSRSSSSASSS